MTSNTQIAQPGLVETVKEAVRPDAIVEKIKMNKNILIDVGLYGTIGFIAGFLIRRYSEFVIFFGIFITALFVLQQFDIVIVSFNWIKVHQLLGLQQSPLIGDAYSSLLFEWVKANVIASGSFAIGFLLGLKLGR